MWQAYLYLRTGFCLQSLTRFYQDRNWDRWKEILGVFIYGRNLKTGSVIKNSIFFVSKQCFDFYNNILIWLRKYFGEDDTNLMGRMLSKVEGRSQCQMNSCVPGDIYVEVSHNIAVYAGIRMQNLTT